jgi:phosphatidate phosphatase PAH1
MKNLVLFLLSLVLITSCEMESQQQESDSGIKKASIKIKTDSEGHSIEQKNIMERLERDNKIGEVKHLYVISSYSGDVLEYSTVRGKVTSGGKRLSPKTVNNSTGIQGNSGTTNTVYIGNLRYYTDEVLDDGGAYGESGNYLFWFDAQDNYHQYYPSGGTYLHISEKPLRVRKANLTFTQE